MAEDVRSEQCELCLNDRYLWLLVQETVHHQQPRRTGWLRQSMPRGHGIVAILEGTIEYRTAQGQVYELGPGDVFQRFGDDGHFTVATSLPYRELFCFTNHDGKRRLESLGLIDQTWYVRTQVNSQPFVEELRQLAQKLSISLDKPKEHLSIARRYFAAIELASRLVESEGQQHDQWDTLMSEAQLLLSERRVMI